MSKFIKLYETLCPDDIILSDDPRRKAIIAEMQHVCKAKTEEEAVKAIEWWDAWPNPEFRMAMDFVRQAREMYENTRVKQANPSSKADLHGATGKGWIGVDLDGTLAFYDGWKGADHIGEPVPKMMDRLRSWLAAGQKVKIMTARVSPGKGYEKRCRAVIEAWLKKHGLAGLEVTHAKDQKMIELWDDRVVQVIPNTGERADGRE